MSTKMQRSLFEYFLIFCFVVVLVSRKAFSGFLMAEPSSARKNGSRWPYLGPQVDDQHRDGSFSASTGVLSW